MKRITSRYARAFGKIQPTVVVRLASVFTDLLVYGCTWTTILYGNIIGARNFDSASIVAGIRKKIHKKFNRFDVFRCSVKTHVLWSRFFG